VSRCYRTRGVGLTYPPRMHLPAAAQRKTTILALVVAIAIGVGIVYGATAYANRNKGENTACPDYVKMTRAERGAVVEKMGYNPAYTTRDRQVAAALAGCLRAQGTSDENDTLEYILGP
jgi:hypothetical protein